MQVAADAQSAMSQAATSMELQAEQQVSQLLVSTGSTYSLLCISTSMLPGHRLLGSCPVSRLWTGSWLDWLGNSASSW